MKMKKINKKIINHQISSKIKALFIFLFIILFWIIQCFLDIELFSLDKFLYLNILIYDENKYLYNY